MTDPVELDAGTVGRLVALVEAVEAAGYQVEQAGLDAQPASEASPVGRLHVPLPPATDEAAAGTAAGAGAASPAAASEPADEAAGAAGHGPSPAADPVPRGYNAAAVARSAAGAAAPVDASADAPQDEVGGAGGRPVGERGLDEIYLESVAAVSDAITDRLRDAGYETVADVQAASPEDLSAVRYIGSERAARITDAVADIAAADDPTASLVDDHSTDYWCGRCGAGPFPDPADVSSHHTGARHDGDYEAVTTPPATPAHSDDQESDEKDDSGDNPTSCTADGCTAEFDSRTARKIHETTAHSDAGPFWCGHCGAGPFETKKATRTHHVGKAHDAAPDVRDTPPGNATETRSTAGDTTSEDPANEDDAGGATADGAGAAAAETADGAATGDSEDVTGRLVAATTADGGVDRPTPGAATDGRDGEAASATASPDWVAGAAGPDADTANAPSAFTDHDATGHSPNGGPTTPTPTEPVDTTELAHVSVQTTDAGGACFIVPGTVLSNLRSPDVIAVYADSGQYAGRIVPEDRDSAVTTYAVDAASSTRCGAAVCRAIGVQPGDRIHFHDAGGRDVWLTTTTSPTGDTHD